MIEEIYKEGKEKLISLLEDISWVENSKEKINERGRFIESITINGSRNDLNFILTGSAEDRGVSLSVYLKDGSYIDIFWNKDHGNVYLSQNRWKYGLDEELILSCPKFNNLVKELNRKYHQCLLKKIKEQAKNDRKEFCKRFGVKNSDKELKKKLNELFLNEFNRCSPSKNKKLYINLDWESISFMLPFEEDGVKSEFAVTYVSRSHNQLEISSCLSYDADPEVYELAEKILLKEQKKEEKFRKNFEKNKNKELVDFFDKI